MNHETAPNKVSKGAELSKIDNEVIKLEQGNESLN